MSLIQEVELHLDDKSRERLAAAMRKAGHQIDEALAQQIGKMSGPQAARLASRMEADMKGATSRIGMAMESLKATVARVGTAIVAAFAIQRVIAFGKSLLVAAMESEASWSKLNASLVSVGLNLGHVRKEVDALALSLRNQADDEDVADILGGLVQISGDYARSLTAVSVVIDLARARHMTLEAATLLVGKAINGQIEGFSRQGIVINKSSDALEQLRKQFKGFGEQSALTLTGQVNTLSNAWTDVKETFGAFITDASSGMSIIQALTTSMRWLNAEIGQWTPPARIAKEMHLGEVEDKLARMKGKSDSSLMFDEEGNTSTWGTQRPKLLALQLQLTRELNAEAKQAYADRIGSAKALEESAKHKRQTEEQIAAALKAQLEIEKAKADEWARAFPLWAATRQGEVGADASAVRGTPLSGRANLINPAVPIFSASEVTGNLSDSIAANVTAALKDLAANPPGDLLTGWDSLWGSLFHSGQNIALAITDAWSGAFRQMMEDGATVGNFFQGLGQSIARSMTQGLAMFAQSKVLENIAEAVEMGAKAWGYFASGNVPSGVAATKAAAGHALAATAWGALAGAGNAAGGMGATSRGGLGSGFRTGAGTKDSLESERRGATINITLDGIDPSNPRHGDLVIATMGAAQERYGGTVIVNGRRQG